MNTHGLARRISRLEKALGPVRPQPKPRDPGGPTSAELRQLLAQHGVDFDQIVREGIAQYGPRVQSNPRDFWIMLREGLVPYPQTRRAVSDFMDRLVAFNEQQRAQANQDDGINRH